ncbi:MAG: type I-E CRISPR-associated protein Cse2/CasB [Acidithiobacillus sp.]
MNDKSDQPFPRGKPDHPSYAVLRTWWQGLEQDRGERAALRRAGTLTAVMLSPAFHRLLRELRQGGCGMAESRYPKLAAIAGLAARVKAEAPRPLANRMGSPKPGGNAPVVAELRMRNLLACDDLETLYTLMRRALSLLDDQVNLADMAAVVWHWSPMDEKRPNDPRRQMAYDYYAAAPL